MTVALMFLGMVALILINVPIAISLGLVGMGAMVHAGGMDSLRNAAKPECISAEALRAQARAAASAGHAAGCCSATYSAMASESQTTVLPSTRQGTLPVGENLRNLP